MFDSSKYLVVPVTTQNGEVREMAINKSSIITVTTAKGLTVININERCKSVYNEIWTSLPFEEVIENLEN